MGAPAVGDVVVIAFPYSDLSASKRRPAAVVGLAERGEVILCQITSRPYASRTSVELERTDLTGGDLQRVSYARPDKLFTASPTLIRSTIGALNDQARARLVGRVAALFVE